MFFDCLRLQLFTLFSPFLLLSWFPWDHFFFFVVKSELLFISTSCGDSIAIFKCWTYTSFVKIWLKTNRLSFTCAKNSMWMNRERGSRLPPPDGNVENDNNDDNDGGSIVVCVCVVRAFLFLAQLFTSHLSHRFCQHWSEHSIAIDGNSKLKSRWQTTHFRIDHSSNCVMFSSWNTTEQNVTWLPNGSFTFQLSVDIQQVELNNSCIHIRWSYQQSIRNFIALFVCRFPFIVGALLLHWRIMVVPGHWRRSKLKTQNTYR